MELTDQEKNTLLDIAKNAIAAKINHRETPELNIDSDNLRLKRGAFVTLKKQGRLRAGNGRCRGFP